MKRLIAAALFGGAMLGTVNAQPEQMPQTGKPVLLVREEAVARALTNDPGVAAAAQSIRAASATARQAGLLLNPTLDLQLENFGGTGSLSGVDRAEATYALTQEIEFGGDRLARHTAAEREVATTRIRAGISTLDLREEVELAFVETQAAEAFADVARSRLEVAKEFAEAVDRRVRAARDPEAARTRISARLAEAETEALTAISRARAAKAALASYWGGAPDFVVETAPFFNPDARDYNVEGSPDLALADAERASAAARVEIERAMRVPDLNVRAGFRELRESNDTAFVVGVSIPLPIWNRNSGALAAARANERRAEYVAAARERELVREIASLSSQAAAARTEINAYEERVIPSGEKALAQSLHAYRQGGLSYIEVLDAQSSLGAARLRQISVLRTYHRAEVKLARRRGLLGSKSPQEIYQ